MPASIEAVLLLLGCLTAAAAHSSHRLTHHHEDGWLPQPPAVSDHDPDSQKDENNNIKQDPFSISSQLMVRTTRGNRVYDVPQIECPPAPEEDVMERFACPTPDHMGRYRCIDDHVLCDGFIDCPGGEDEDRQACMFYRTTKAHLDILADALLRWARGR